MRAPRVIAVLAPVIVDRGSSRMGTVSGAVIRAARRLAIEATVNL
jgi:hypothetical protein